MTLNTSSGEIDKESLTPMSQITKALDKPSTNLKAAVTKHSTAREEWFIHEVEQGIKAANEGRLIEHADIKAKWERAHFIGK